MATAKDVFEKRLPDLFARAPEQARQINASYCFKISGPGGGTWTIDLTSNPPTCTPGVTGSPQCTIEVSDADFEQILVNQQLAMQLYFQGKLKVSGDASLATKLSKLFGLAK